MLDRLLLVCLTTACVVLTIALARRAHPPAQIVSHEFTVSQPNGRPTLPIADAILDRRIPTVRFVKTPFGQALFSLGSMARANMIVRIDSLSLARIDPAIPITVELHDVTLGQALAVVMNETDRMSQAERLGFAFVDQTIVISTYGDFDPAPVSMAYNVGNLIARLKRDGDTYDLAMQKITRRLTTTVSPESWPDNGGNLGKIADYDGLLLITQTALHQAEVEEQLQKLQSPGGLELLNPTSSEPTTQHSEDPLKP